MTKEILHQLMVGPQTTLLEGVQALNKGAQKILLVVDGGEYLLGVVTDYDIRQALLRHLEMSAPIEEVMQKEPVVASIDDDDDQIIKLIQNKRCSQIPLLNGEGQVVDIHFAEEYIHYDGAGSAASVVIMAGGLGTRLRPMTDDVPKPLLHVGGRPILFILLDQIISEGFDSIFITVNYKSEMIRNAVNSVAKYRSRVEFVDEDKPLGTAGSLSLLPQRPLNPFLVLNADLLTNISLKDLLQYHRVEKNVVTMATKRDKSVIPYGVAELDGTRVVGLKEKPSISYFVNMGVYAIEPKVLDQLEHGTFTDMPHVIANLLENNQRVGSFPVHEYWLDIGSPAQFEKAQDDYFTHFDNGKNAKGDEY